MIFYTLFVSAEAAVLVENFAPKIEFTITSKNTQKRRSAVLFAILELSFLPANEILEVQNPISNCVDSSRESFQR